MIITNTETSYNGVILGKIIDTQPFSHIPSYLSPGETITLAFEREVTQKESSQESKYYIDL